MILFYGSQDKGFFVEDIADKIGDKVEFSGLKLHIEKERMTRNKYTHIIVDIEPIIDDYNLIGEELCSVMKASGAVIIILAAGYNVASEVVQALNENGINIFIFETLLGRQMLRLEELLTEKENSKIQPPIIPEIPDKKETLMQEIPQTIISAPTSKRATLISVAGSCSRMGTTTQAMQIIKYLLFHGKKACYIEMNDTNFISLINKHFEVADHDMEQGYIFVEGIDMYYKKEKISSILKSDYEYIVYDFGSFEDKGFNPISFAEKDINVVVCGAKASELNATNNMIARTYNDETHYMFNFCPKEDEEDILQLMGNKANKTYFTKYTPNYFS